MYTVIPTRMRTTYVANTVRTAETVSRWADGNGVRRERAF
jgi:hypothetical protein